MSTIFLSGIVGSLAIFLILTKRPYALQEASIIPYTLLVVFFSFARTGSLSGPDLHPFMFSCPAVRPQTPRLLWRHLGFLVALFALQTIALAWRPNLPDRWNIERNRGSPLVLC